MRFGFPRPPSLNCLCTVQRFLLIVFSNSPFEEGKGDSFLSLSLSLSASLFEAIEEEGTESLLIWETHRRERSSLGTTFLAIHSLKKGEEKITARFGVKWRFPGRLLDLLLRLRSSLLFSCRLLSLSPWLRHPLPPATVSSLLNFYFSKFCFVFLF